MANLIIVEDDPDLADMVQAYLESENHQVEVCSSGATAVEVLTTRQFDVIILDLGLPEIPGLEVLRRIRGNGVKTPVLILTGKDTVKEKEEGLDAGADDYVTKPCDLRELAARLKPLLRRPFSGR